MAYPETSGAPKIFDKNVDDIVESLEHLENVARDARLTAKRSIILSATSPRSRREYSGSLMAMRRRAGPSFEKLFKKSLLRPSKKRSIHGSP